MNCPVCGIELLGPPKAYGLCPFCTWWSLGIINCLLGGESTDFIDSAAREKIRIETAKIVKYDRYGYSLEFQKGAL